MITLHKNMQGSFNQARVAINKSAAQGGLNRTGKQELFSKKPPFIKTLYIMTLLALFLIAAVSPAHAGAASGLSSTSTTLTFTPVGDAQVVQKRPNKNYGPFTYLGVDGSRDSASSAYIRFDVTNVSGLVQSATLRVYCTTQGTKNGPAAYLVADSNWIESGIGGITWKQKPALSSGPFDNKRAIARASWVDYNVTGLVTGNGPHTFALVADSRDDVIFSSREGPQPPQLILITSSGTSAQPSPTAFRVDTATATATDLPTNTPTSTLPPTSTLSPTAVPSLTSTPIILPTATPTTLPISASSGFPVGWWLHQTSPLSYVGTYAASGEQLFLLDGGYCGVDQLPTFKKFLAEAAKYNNKVIVKIACQDNTTQGISDADMTTTINELKSYPALWAWSTADEPEFSDNAAVRQRHHDRLLYSYNMIKRLDPSHPIFISFDFNGFEFGYAAQFYDVADAIGIHAYPYYNSTGVLSSGEMYDLWKGARTWAGGKPFVATMQGFGPVVSPYRSPTLAESRYQTFSAVVQGVPNILFWMNQWSERSGDTGTVLKVMSEVQAIGTEMQNGKTNDPVIGVSVTDRNQLTYRFGVNNGRAVLLAVNIANRTSGGFSLSNVRFTVPAGFSSVQVLDENRVLPITNNTFTDSFSKFEVHIYLLTP